MTPHERALVRFVEGLIGAFVIAASMAGLQYLSSGSVAMGFDLKVLASTVLLAGWQAAVKYAQAHADVPLGAQVQPSARPAVAVQAKADAWANDTNPPVPKGSKAGPGPAPPPGWSPGNQ